MPENEGAGRRSTCPFSEACPFSEEGALMAYVGKKGAVDSPSGRFLIFGRFFSMRFPEEWIESQRIG